jgi:predicted ATPase
MSDGELAYIALLSLIYAPIEAGSSLICIEEPENHLHPKLLQSIVTLTRQVRRELTDANVPLSQIMVTTQSPLLVDQLNLEEIIWVEKRKGETIALRPSDEHQLRRLIEDKDLGLGDIVYSGLLGQSV